MPYKLPEQGYWFAPKRHGIGAGRPIAWQGWALVVAYVAAMAVTATFMPGLGRGAQWIAVLGMIGLTGLFMTIAAKRTRGGWRWRQGERD